MRFTRTRGYHYHFFGQQHCELMVFETITFNGTKFYCRKREHGLACDGSSLKRLIKVLACIDQETTIHLGVDGWAVQVWSECSFNRCLSNSTKENENSSTVTN